MSPQPAPLAISCKQTHCAPGVPARERRHSYLDTAGALPGIGGTCRSCGADPVDWELCHARDVAQIQSLIEQMRSELIREVYWSAPLPEHVLRLARRREPDALRGCQQKMLARELTPPQSKNPLLATHTYYGDRPRARIIHCAQHATGTCCRACIQKWHGIPREHQLDPGELDYLELLTWTYTERRLGEGKAQVQLAPA